MLRFNFEIRWRFSPPAPKVFLESPANTTFLIDQLGRQHQLLDASGISPSEPVVVPVDGSRRFNLSFPLSPNLKSFNYQTTLLIKRPDYEGRLHIRSKKEIYLTDFE
jgi:hypothetical protein